MAKEGAYAGDLEIGDIVRWEEQVWRVTRADRMGPDEVEVYFVKLDDSDQLVLNMLQGQIVERVT